MGKIYDGINFTDSGGTGRVVVLLHGWSSSLESWDKQVSALAASGNRVICIDRRGCGGSQATFRLLSFDNLADDIETILQSLDLTDVTLVGFCMGGGEVARYIRRHGLVRLRAAVFASSATPFAPNVKGSFSLTPEDAQKWFTEDASRRSSCLEDYISNAHSTNSSQRAAASNLWKAIALAERCDAGSLMQCLSLIQTEDFSDDLEIADLPCLVLHGDQDMIYPIDKTAIPTHAILSRSDIEILRG